MRLNCLISGADVGLPDREADCYAKVMTVTIELPDDIARPIASEETLARTALEALAIEGYRRKALTQVQVGRLLGWLASRGKISWRSTLIFTTTQWMS